MEKLFKEFEIKRDGILVYCNQDLVDEYLFGCREFKTKEELIELRNEYVMALDIEKEKARENKDWNLFDKLDALMTVITGTIDERYYRLLREEK